jgi:hypothetical protein
MPNDSVLAWGLVRRSELDGPRRCACTLAAGEVGLRPLATFFGEAERWRHPLDIQEEEIHEKLVQPSKILT